MDLPTTEEWVGRCASDGEFMLAARYWNGGLALDVGGRSLRLPVRDGQPVATGEISGDLVEFTGSEAVWEKMLAAVPERFNNDLMANMMQDQGLSRDADSVTFAQYYPAIARALELLRPATDEGAAMAHDAYADGAHSAPVGRYIHLTLSGLKHRIYYEEAGVGIPVLLQHTAGCHGSQWRHLMEDRSITSRFRLIAYDLPYHGKSVPPVETDWWNQQYLLKGDFLRSIPLALSSALRLDRPVFMGCSVGGLMALDLAHKYPDSFRAVISLEGALSIGGSLDEYAELWHPQVSNEYKARLMDAIMSPTSPKRYRKETSWVYASGWPPVFLGDLYYYVEDLDLTGVASEIDTSRVAVHILSGEYDASGTVELGRAAHEAIRGSTFSEMKGVGHFPMSENPKTFIKYLKPVLDSIS